MNKRICLLFLLSLFCFFSVKAQPPQAFMYSAQAIDSDGNPVQFEDVTLRLSIVPGNTDEATVYSEVHSEVTDANGMVDVEVGNGILVNGEFESIDWGAAKHFLKVEVDADGGTEFELQGFMQLLSVPYALFAHSAANAGGDSSLTNELQTLSRTGDDITLSANGGTVSVTDGDADATNELQMLSISSDSIRLSANGGVVSIADADANPSNEIQTISRNGILVQLSQNGGSASIEDDDSDPTNELQIATRVGDFVFLNPGAASFSIADDDNDPANEMQTLSRQGNSISLTNGGSVSINDADSNPQNELQQLSRTGNEISLTNGGNPVSVEDDDSDSSNEIQQLSLSGDTLSISSGNFVRIPQSDSSAPSPWQQVPGGIAFTDGNVAIGTDSTNHALEVAGTVQADELDGPWNQSDQGYLRLGDIQICWGTYFSDEVTVMPMPFIDNTYSLSLTPETIRQNARFAMCDRLSKLPESFVGLTYWQNAAGNNVVSGIDGSYIAIGKWK